MKDEELFEEIDTHQSVTERYLGLSLGKFFLALVLIVLLGIYIGVLLYGTNSLEVLFHLEDYEADLKEKVVSLKKENAELQREYFELKEISAQ
jgi:cell division protein FtsB